ncbi:MAG: type II toxin-antitoxin system Phd/YefM family antitoxin [Candidatus Pacebacteria bacterium]|nr:type II toxin-antitoxin system Phd/YefM family antitoxin [Candidatus Paceibacterota bacterium]
MSQTISKSQFKPQVLEYFRMVEKSKKPLIITHDGKPTIKISAYSEDTDSDLAQLKSSVVSYIQPTKPVGTDEWEALQ